MRRSGEAPDEPACEDARPTTFGLGDELARIFGAPLAVQTDKT
jgi:hypothetical protein